MASEKINALVEEIKALTVLEVSELVKELEEVFGVSAAAPVAVAAAVQVHRLAVSGLIDPVGVPDAVAVQAGVPVRRRVFAVHAAV